MEIEVSEKAIYKLIPKEQYASKHLSDMLCEKFGDQSVFAKFKTTVGKLVWYLPGTGWNQYSSAPDDVKSEIDGIIAEKRVAVHKELSGELSQWIDALFTIPSNDYIYYRQRSDNSLEVKLVAWDYKLPAQHLGGAPVVIKGGAPTVKQEAKLVVMEGTRAVPYYEFLMKIPTDKKKAEYAVRTTDENGVFDMKERVVGFRGEVCTKSKTKSFEFTVQKGQREYVFDISEMCVIDITVKKDGVPYDGCELKLNYSSESYSLLTDSSGYASQTVLYHDGASVIVVAEGESKTVNLVMPNTVVVLDLKSPVTIIEDSVPEPVTKPELPYVPHIYVKDQHGSSLANYPIEVLGDSSSSFYRTDEHGCVALEEKTMPVKLIVRDGNNTAADMLFNASIDASTCVYIVNVKKEEKYRIRIKDVFGNPLSNSSLAFSLPGGDLSVAADNEGLCLLDKDSVPSGREIITKLSFDGVNDLDPLNVVFEEGEDEYEIVYHQIKRTSFGKLLLEVLAGLLIALGLLFIFLVFLELFF